MQDERDTMIRKERVRQLRKELGITQASLAEALGISQNHLSAIENGKRGASDKVKKRITEVLHTSIAYLMGETDDPNPVPKRLSFLPPHRDPNPPAPGTIEAEIDELEQRMLEEDAKDPSRLFLSLRTTIKHREELGPKDKEFIVALLRWGIARLEGRPEGDIEHFPAEEATDEDF